MTLRTAYEGFTPSRALGAEFARIEELWSLARERHGGAAPWLFGAYSLADAFYAPVAAHIVAYGLPTGQTTGDYVAAQLAHPSFQRWRAEALTEAADPDPYPRPLSRRPWPGPAVRPAHAVEHGPALKALCPYSNRPVTRFLETDGRCIGFCTERCRDKTVNDPDAWDAFRELAGLD